MSKAIESITYGKPHFAKTGPTKKWAFAHWCVPPKPRTTQQFQIQIYPAREQKTNGLSTCLLRIADEIRSGNLSILYESNVRCGYVMYANADEAKRVARRS